MFPLLILVATLAVWLPRQDKGPPLTDHGKRMAIEDSLALTDTITVKPTL